MARKQLDPSERNPLNQTREIRALRKQIEDLTPVATASIADDAVTFAKMQNIATDRLIGRDTASAGDPEEISLSTGLEFSGSASIRLADNGTSNAKLADMAQNTIKGRVTASPGDPEDLTATQARTVMGLATTDSPEFAGLNIGHASDTTITRTGAGDIAVEGNAIYRQGGADASVADGGTGRSSHTAYAVICGGTTATSAQQSVASVGTAGQLLTSNGAGALPTFQDAPDTGQPIPSSATYPVGTMAFLTNDSGSGVVSGASAAGSGLRSTILGNTATPVAMSGATQTGTWLNIAGQTIAGTGTTLRVGYFVRTA